MFSHNDDKGNDDGVEGGMTTIKVVMTEMMMMTMTGKARQFWSRLPVFIKTLLTAF